MRTSSSSTLAASNICRIAATIAGGAMSYKCPLRAAFCVSDETQDGSTKRRQPSYLLLNRQRTQQKAPQAVLRKRTFTQGTANATKLRPGASNRLMFVEDARLPQDVVRKQYSDTRDALCCLN